MTQAVQEPASGAASSPDVLSSLGIMLDPDLFD